MTKSRDSNILAPAPEVADQLRAKFPGLEDWWKDTHGYGFDALTEKEGQQLLRSESSDRLRNRFAQAEQARGRRAGAGETEGEESGFEPGFENDEPGGPAGPGESGAPGGNAAGVEPPRSFDIAGAEPGAALKVTPELRAQAASYLKGNIPDAPIQASLEGLARDPDMNRTIADVARFVPKDAVKPDDVLRMNAYSLGLSPQEVLGTGLGNLPDDEHMLAWNMLINSGATQLRDLAVKAVAENTPEANEAFVRAFTLQ